MPVQRQRLYIDESGDHAVAGVKPSSWDKRYLCLFGCSFDFDYCLNALQSDVNALKAAHFGVELDDPVILHREDISSKRGVFACLRDNAKNREYQEHFLRFLAAVRFRAFAVVIDKLSTKNSWYGLTDSNPYHISLLAILERYCGWLRFTRQVGDVLAESRGGREDQQLKAAYRAICKGGSRYRPPAFFSSVLTSQEIKLKPKAANIPGLQISDHLAYAAKRRILEENNRAKPLTGFEKEIADALEAKYNRHEYNGRINGYGKVFLT